MLQPKISSWATHPSVNPEGKYKFSSMGLYVDQRVLTTNRSTYNILECLGDIGGLMDALVLICKIVMLPITTLNLKSFLLTIMFRLVPSRKCIDQENYSNSENENLQKILKRSTTIKLIDGQNEGKN